jgi:hypothetical protein
MMRATEAHMLRLATIWLSVVVVVACGNDDGVGLDGTTVGGPCDSDQDCAFRCREGGEYPGGTCVRPCNIDADCPEGTFCINEDGGICLLSCAVPQDCRDGYNCEGRENRGHGGDSLVCRGN